MRTNSELYRFVTSLPRTERSLEAYLRALWVQLTVPIELDAFAAALEAALTAEPAVEPPAGLAAWEEMLWRHVAELRAGDDDTWVNGVVWTWLDCAAEGAFRGYTAEDEEPLGPLDADDVMRFLGAGKTYE